MGLFSSLIESLASFVRRNPIFCAVILLLAVFAPSVLTGTVMIIFYCILFFFLLSLFTSLLIRRRLRTMARDFERTAQRNRNDARRGTQREGEVRVYTTEEAQRPTVNDEVGDYVDFEEVKKTERDAEK